MNKWPCIVGTVLILFCGCRWLYHHPDVLRAAVAFVIILGSSVAWTGGVILFFMKMGWLPPE